MSAKKSLLDAASQAENLASAQQELNRLQLNVMEQAVTALSARAAELTQAGNAQHATPEIRTRAARYQAMVSALTDTRRAWLQLPQPSSDSFILHGRVVSAAGKALPGLTVSLSDPKGILNNRVPAVKTDVNGYFTMTLRAAEYPDLTAGSSQIFVTVADAQQKEIAKPAQPLTFQPGKVAVMPIAT